MLAGWKAATTQRWWPQHILLGRRAVAEVKGDWQQQDANRLAEEENMLIKVLKFAFKGRISSFMCS